jgi:hypothetical protein
MAYAYYSLKLISLPYKNPLLFERLQPTVQKQKVQTDKHFVGTIGILEGKVKSRTRYRQC